MLVTFAIYIYKRNYSLFYIEESEEQSKQHLNNLSLIKTDGNGGV